MKIVLAVNGLIPCVGYGGTERQVDWLARELARLGHRIVLVAFPGSTHSSCEVRHAESLEDCVKAIPKDADLVHFHGWHQATVEQPSLFTLHGYKPDQGFSGRNWSFVSASHAELHGFKTFVYNGFPVDEYRLSSTKNDRLLFMAGIGKAEKNLNRAVSLARIFDFHLDVAGGSRWKLLNRRTTRRQGVFWKSIGSRYRFHGVVDGERKLRLLGSAKAFLNPIAWDEPFGMAPVEAMLCGTPVLTTARGALTETVDVDTGRFFRDRRGLCSCPLRGR